MNISEILGILGGTTVLATGLSTFFSKIFLNNLSIEWKKQADLEIENVRSELNEETDRLLAILKNSSDIHSLGQNERLKAVKNLWENVIKIRNLNKSTSYIYTILSPEEYNKKLNNDFVKDILETIPEIEQLAVETNEIMIETEKYRPFLNEYLWGLFSVYNAFSTRLTYKLKENSKKKNIKVWYEDDGLNYLMKTFFSYEELNSIELESQNSIKFVIDRMEEKIILECGKIISEDFAMKKSIKQSSKLKKPLIKIDNLRTENKK